MKPSSKKKGAAILKVNVPKFKFEKANEYQQMYEEAFEMGQRSFEEKIKQNSKKFVHKESQQQGKLPSLIKNQSNSSRIKSGKLKPLEDKLSQSRFAQKRSFVKAQNNMEWIQDMTKKEYSKIQKPARSPERLNQSMKKNPAQIQISPKKNHQVQSQMQETFSNTLNLTKGAKQGASRNLKDYDCWQNDLKPQQWLKMYQNTPAPHGKAPIYSNGQYVWTDIQLINYDEKSGKFYIRVLSTGLLKFVSRLSIQFKDQDQEKFQQRLNLTKERQKNADQSIKLFKYIELVDQKIIAPMPKELSQSLTQNHSTHPMFGGLLQEIKQIHNNYEKKFLLYDKKNQMMLPQPIPSVEQFSSLPIKTYQRYNDFQVSKNMLQQQHISSKPKQLKCQKQILQKGIQIINKYKLLGSLPQNTGIFLLDNFKQRLEKETLNSKENWQIIWRSHIISQIQHILKEQYRFFVTQKQTYESDHLKKVIIKFDVLFNTIVRQKIIAQSIENYVNFISSFMPPKPNQFYKLRNNPLLILQMNINVTAIKKKKKKSKNMKETNLEEELVQETIFYEPSIQAVQEILLSPFQILQNISSSFNKIERDLIPLLNLQSVPSYPITKEDPVLALPSNFMIDFIKQASKKPVQILDHFKAYSYLIQKSTSSILKKLFPEKSSITYLDKQQIQSKLNQIYTAKKIIQRLSIDQVNCGLFQVRTKNAKQILVTRANQILNEILKKILEICSQSIKAIRKNYQERQKRLMPQEPSLLNQEELKELHKLVSQNDTTMQKLKNQVDTIANYFLVLEQYLYQIDDLTFANFWSLKEWPQNIKDAVGQATRIIQERQAKLSQKLDTQKDLFNKKLQEIQKQLEQIKKYAQYSQVGKYYSRADKFKTQIQECKKQVESFNHRQQMFKQPQSTYEQLDSIQANFQPYFRMWSTAIKFDAEKQKTINGPLLKNNFTALQKLINRQFLKQTIQLSKQFDNLNNDVATNIINQMKEDIEKFRQRLWIIQLLTTEALIKKQHYWKEISDACNVAKIQPNDQLTLKIILDLGLDQFRQQIQQISKKAQKQWSLQKKLNGIVEQLKKLQIQTKPYPKAGTFILQAIDDSTQILDDNLNSLLMMKSSPYIKPILTRANNVQARIVLIQDTLQNWIKTQRNWMYLQPIFSSQDIQQKMPKQKMKFEQVDKHWKVTLQFFTKQKNMWDNIESQRYKTQFQNSNKLLDQIQKSLTQYLQTKRKFFPRFYFLSDEQLLQILAQTKDPQTVQRHINKCFEGIGQLKMNKGIVSGMISMEKQQVDFCKKVDVNEGQKKGNVERWLFQIEGVMIQTLKRITKSAIQDQTPRVDWVRKFPAQTVLGVNMIRWTAKAQEAITNGTIKQFVNELVDQLKDIVVLVRTDLSFLDRLTLGALVTIDVHGKDVIQSLLQQNCSHPQEFSWIAQLRYYWLSDRFPKNPLPVKMINAELLYAFQYLGNSPRLVITPLTDRCYRTLMGAFHLNYGGAPEGPAGTGKTETVKDLAKALSVFCVVFNCSDGLNYIAMRKFFKGLASSGSWCCFDQFNRIDLQVLSVIAQQVLTIQSAIRQKKKIFNFDGEDIVLIPSCAINITMNPGYAGRSELPDNLKALFRPCAMMVPDYALIAQIYLYSVGFQQARDLARKIVASLRLSSQQLSSQDHYDFGMRALKAILTAGGNLKRVMQNDSEDVVCLRALMDVNIPKFTVNDVPLFSSITSDLFPSTKLPKIDYGKLQESFVTYCQSKNLQPEQGFLSKCIQLYDTVNVRHGLMIVGAAFSGKSKVTQVLAEGISSLAGLESFVKVQQIKLNPKSITSDQLYGKLDPNTKSWSDGVIAIIMRKCAEQAQVKQRKWVVFDGPVDAVWIQNMNTVLDDNKKLCLTSGQIIKLTNWMTMMFQVQDLAVASPATVSRCGMVFLQTKQLGWFALVKTFILNINQKLKKYGEHLTDKIKYIINGCLAWTRKYGKFLVHQSQMTFVNTFLNILNCYFKPYGEQQAKIPKQIQDIISNLVVFSAIWSIGIAIEQTSRKGFNSFFIHLINGSPDIIQQSKIDPDYSMSPLIYGTKLPQKVNIFDMFYNSQKLIWQNWSQTVPPFVIPKNISYNDLIIPTNDSIRHNYFLNLNVTNHMHVLFCGPTGTGKSINVANQLNVNYYNQTYTFLTTAFSGQTVANQVQRLIDSKVCTRRRKGYFWPQQGKNQIVIFIDDLNMPQKEKFGAQPPIELLRQWMDNQGWYDLDTKEFKHLCGINFVAAMLPPIGGRNVVTMRYLRHYNLIYVQPFDTESLVKIFGNILQWYFINLPQALPKAITNLKDTLVNSTIQLYTKVQTSKQLLPTPAKSHYIYNLRDLSKVFQGITKATNKSFNNESDFIKLWAHQCSRIFKDRLISIQDQNFFESLLKDMLRTNFKREWSSLVQVQPLLWASFVPMIYPDGDTTKKPLNDIYCQLTNRDAVKKKCLAYLEEYNNLYSANKMNLVLFMVAIQHIIKIVRVITTTFGHALLVGVGGSGRKSLAMLSSYIAYMSQYNEVNSKNWVQQVQKIMKIAGLQQRQTIFLFSDTQILKQSMVQQVCNILNNGQIPNLFPTEQKAKIVQQITAIKPVGSFNQKYQYFVSLCKSNLHMVICMSPVGQDFRRRLRTFPTLVNCTTIDWFLPWPQQALVSTADNHFKQAMNINDNVLRKGLVQICVDMQMRVTKLRNRYQQQLRRYYYVTPTSYLQLLNTLKKLLSNRKSMVDGQIKRYQDGCNKIAETQAQVQVMQKQLQELKPKLQIATIQNKELLVVLQKNQKEADAKKEVCQMQEKQCNIQRDQANALRADCQKDLDRVLPLLDQAAAALDKITQDDMTQLKSYNNPPASAAIVMQGVCYVFNEDQNVKFTPKEPGSMQKIQDFWSYSKKNLLNAKLIQKVKDFREDKIKAIPQRNINKLKLFIQKPQFQKQKVFTASKAAGSLSLWIRAVINTYEALLVVEPKKKQLSQAQEKLNAAEKDLAQKKAALEEVLSLLRKLQEQYKNAKQKEEQLKKNVERCIIQLDRAQKLIKGLGGQKISWGKKVVQWTADKQTVLGDCVLCSGIIAYMGAFPITYRQETISQWKQLLHKLSIKSSQTVSLQNVLSDPLVIGVWTNSQQLPNDDFSIDNAIIMKNSSRWPLMIDPQIQANNWIRNMQGSNLKIIRQTKSAKQLQMILENSIQVGLPLLLQNIGETIDSLFEPVLLKKLIKSGASYRLKFGDKELEYSTDFRFYMTTKLGRPHYSPEVCVKVTLLNFQVTLEGLDDQMLNIVVKMQEPIKQQQKQRNIKQFFDNKNKQKATQDLILKLLGSAQGNLLDDEQLINTLQNSKKQSQQIAQKMEKLQYFRTQFNGIRNFYKQVSKRIANLYFITLDLANIEPTYQWSLQFYINLFQRAIDKSIQGKQNRCKNIIDKFQILFYESLCRSLLQKDKLIYSFLIFIKIMSSQKKISNNQVRFMMVGGTWIQSPIPIPDSIPWMTNKIWCTICQISKNIKGFESLVDDFKQYKKQFTDIYNSYDPYEEKWPGKWKDASRFHRLILIRIIRSDKFTHSIQKIISDEIGKQYIEPPPFNLQQAYIDSDCNTPLIFILSPGADPRIQITNLAEKTGFKNNFALLSLGQGQGQLAQKAIKSAMAEGKWVLLQNCHLAPSFMPDLQRILQNATQIHRDFRIWLTSMPSNVFPVTILMKGIKMTYQPPRGLKNNLLRSFNTIDETKFQQCQKPKQWKKMFLGLSFFHALILQRRKYGPLGWNIPYQFTAADFAISQSQLKMFLNEYQMIPYQALNYMAAQANYGGRVTDPMDRRLIKIILKRFYSQQILKNQFKMTKDGVYKILDEPTFDLSLNYIKSLPMNDSTQVFGLHQNAQISSAIIETNTICETILMLLPRDVGGGGASAQTLIKTKIKQILAKLPKPFDTDQTAKTHPVKYQESMNTVLQQQLFRFNKLLKTVHSSLINVDKAIDGFVVMSQQLQIVFNSLFDNRVPDMWHKVSYPSLKPLGSWINDFIERLKFMQKWIDQGAPPNFWISGFFFTQSFLTGVLQNYARKYKIPIDTLAFDFLVIPKNSKQNDVNITPKDGCYVYGLFLDGARWDQDLKCMNQSYNKILYSSVPYIWFLPTNSKKQASMEDSYICPVYKTSIRRGVLSTTGHSTNYVLSVQLPVQKSTNSDHWVKRGVAMLTQLDD